MPRNKRGPNCHEKVDRMPTHLLAREVAAAIGRYVDRGQTNEKEVTGSDNFNKI